MTQHLNIKMKMKKTEQLNIKADTSVPAANDGLQSGGEGEGKRKRGREGERNKSQ